MAGCYTWDLSMDPENLTINIPDEINDGYKVTDLGGFIGIGVPSFFDIECGRDRLTHHGQDSEYLAFYGTDPDQYDYPVSFEKVIFTVNIGKNVKSIKLQYDANPDPVIIRNDDGTIEYREVEGRNQYIAIEQDDGSVIWYEVILYFNVDAENEYYYSVNGKLFKK